MNERTKEALNKMADNAKELELDYEPDAPCLTKDPLRCDQAQCKLNGECKEL
jgi:hypothetical protein